MYPVQGQLMKKKDIEKAVFDIIGEYIKVLESSAKRTLIASESMLPYSKRVIKNAIRVALLMIDEEDIKEHLKSSYISLGNFVPDEEAKKAEEISLDLFPFIEMDEDKKRSFLRERFKSGLLGDYEVAIHITRRIAEEQKRLREEIEEFLRE